MPPVAPSTMGADDRTNAKDALISLAAANLPLASSATPYSLQSFALPPRAGRVIVFDTETTGFGMDDAIVEIAAIEIEDGTPTGVQFHAFVNPGSRSSNAFAQKVHGLASAFLARQPSAAHVLPAFFRFVAGAPLVAHNAAFDYRMLWVECNRHRLEAPSPRSVYCTQREHQRMFPNQGTVQR